jgi:hypothetical protein
LDGLEAPSNLDVGGRPPPIFTQGTGVTTESSKTFGDRVDRACDGGHAMVIQGEAGIGKSALLADAGRLATAAGVRVLTTGGVESETQVAFSGLYQLVCPSRGEAANVPDRQRTAVLAAFARHCPRTAADQYPWPWSS